MRFNFFGAGRPSTQPAVSDLPSAMPRTSAPPEPTASEAASTGLSTRRQTGHRLPSGSLTNIQRPAIDPAIAQALSRAGAAHVQVLARIDAQAAASVAVSARQQSTNDIAGRCLAADAAAVAALATRAQAAIGCSGSDSGSVAALKNARGHLQLAQTTHARTHQAHATAAQAAVTAATAATQAHRALAAASSAAAEALRAAHGARAEAVAQRAVVHRAAATLEHETALVSPDSHLRQAATDATRAHEAAVEAMLAAHQASAREALPQRSQAAEQRLQAAITAVEASQAALSLQQLKVQAARQALTDARASLSSPASREALANAASDDAEAARVELATRAARADDAARLATAHRDSLAEPVDVSLDRLQETVATLCEALRPVPAPADTVRRPVATRLIDRLRRPLDNLRSRAVAPRVDLAIGPFSQSSSATVPTLVKADQAQVHRPTSATSERGRKQIDGKVRAAAGHAGGLLAGGSGRVDRPAETPSAFGSAVAFNAEVGRMFAAQSTAGVLPDAGPAAAPAAARLALALLDSPNPDPVSRPDGHRLRHEQSLLIASVLRSVTAEPAQALRIHDQLRRGAPPIVSGLIARSADPIDGGGVPTHAEQRMVNAARRALAATAGGFQTLLDLQGLSLPPEGDPSRRHAEQSLEHYKLGLRAEDALLALGLQVGGAQSTADVWAAIEAHPQRQHLLDPTRLGTGNARRRPGGPHEQEHPATLAAQAFMHATENARRGPETAESRPEMKPAYVALRNGFTESGQGSDFHLMAKRLRKFITYIDLACKTPQGQLPTAWDKVRLPVRAMRRLAGKDKTPLKTLLQAGPLGSALGTMTLSGKTSVDADIQRVQTAFDDAQPAQRRDILRQVMNAVVTGGPLTSYSDGRKNGIGGTVGYGAASVAGLGGLSTGVTPMIDFNVDRTRTAVFRAGAAETGVLYLGSERTVNGSIGAGVRVGAEVGPVVNLSAQAVARLGGSHLVSKGLMIRTNTQGHEHQTLSTAQTAGMRSDNWKQMSELVVNSIFQIADQPAADRPANGGAMWSQLMGKLGAYRDISFGWNEAKARTVDLSVSLDGTASAKVFPGVGFSATAGVGLKRTLLNKKGSRDVAGAARGIQTDSGSRTAIGAGASLGIGHPALKTPGGRNVALLGQHKVGVETELVLQSMNGFVRIATQDGRVKPELSAKHRELGVRDDFVKLMNTQRALWEPCLGEHGPDGRLHGGKDQLDAFLRQAVNLPPGQGYVYIERKCLTSDAADTINACMDRLAVLQRPLPPDTPRDPGVSEQLVALQQQIAAHVAEESSWRPAELVVAQGLTATKARSVGAGASVSALTASGPGDFADRFLGGGRVTLGGTIRAAAGVRPLLSLNALPVPQPTFMPSFPEMSRQSTMVELPPSMML